MGKTMISLQIDENEKLSLEEMAHIHGMTRSDLLRKGAKLYGSLPPGFLEQMKIITDAMELPLPTIIIHNLQKLYASYKAWLNVFAALPPGITREFRWEEGALVKGDKLSTDLEREYTEQFQILKNAMVESVEKDEPFEITKEQAFQVMALR